MNARDTLKEILNVMCVATDDDADEIIEELERLGFVVVPAASGTLPSPERGKP